MIEAGSDEIHLDEVSHQKKYACGTQVSGLSGAATSNPTSGHPSASISCREYIQGSSDVRLLFIYHNTIGIEVKGHKKIQKCIPSSSARRALRPARPRNTPPSRHYQ